MTRTEGKPEPDLSHDESAVHEVHQVFPSMSIVEIKRHLKKSSTVDEAVDSILSSATQEGAQHDDADDVDFATKGQVYGPAAPDPGSRRHGGKIGDGDSDSSGGDFDDTGAYAGSSVSSREDLDEGDNDSDDADDDDDAGSSNVQNDDIHEELQGLLDDLAGDPLSGEPEPKRRKTAQPSSPPNAPQKSKNGDKKH